MTTSPLARAGALLAAIAVVAALVGHSRTPPAVVPADAPDSAFSAARALRHVQAIAERPHPVGSADHARVRGYLLDELRALGLEAHVQETVGVGTRYPMAGTVRNVVGRLRGRDTTRQAVLLVSHYDSQGAAPGAGDAASGTAAILETLRALRAGAPLRHDVVALFTDAEEAGLLGAAAFAREHPWARDARMILNLEARGTAGRAFMFETGAGNLDAARVLREVPHAAAASLMVTVYRALPNDTDLTELMPLGIPAMNFAFIDGVERYHTVRDDVAHLDPRSLQHEGEYALALARRFAADTLPRPVTGDAVFFEVPLVGVVVYPEAWRWPIALVAIGLVLAVLVRVRRAEPRWARGVAHGIVGAVAALVIAPLAGAAVATVILWMHRAAGWGGAPEWRDGYHAAVVGLAAAAAAAAWIVTRRRATPWSAHAGALVTWAVLAVAVTWLAPGASYLVTWPVVAAAAAALIGRPAEPAAPHRLLRTLADAVAAIVSATLLVPVIYLLGTALGIQLPGAIAASVLTALLVAMLSPSLEGMAGGRRWLPAVVPLAAAVALVVHGAATVRPDTAFPTRASLTHEMDAGATADPLPRAVLLRDSTAGGRRAVMLRVLAPDSTRMVRIAADAPVLEARIAGRIADRSRLRRPSRTWTLGYVAPPDTGIVLELEVPPTTDLRLDLVAQLAGVPDSVAARAERGPAAVPSQAGDVTLIRWSGVPVPR